MLQVDVYIRNWRVLEHSCTIHTHTHFDSVYSGSSVLVLPLPVSPAKSLTLLSGLAEMMENRSPREEGANHSGESGIARDTLR